MKQPFIREMVRDSVAGLVNHPGGGGAAGLIAGLFAQGQQGFWLPFTDFASLSQDSAGTLPYTALEQPVGRVLDRSGRGNNASQVTSTARGVVSAAVVSPPTRPYYLQLDGVDDFYTCGGGGSTTGFYYSDVITNLKPPGSNMVLFSDQVGNSGYEIVLNSTNGLIAFKAGNGSIIGSINSDVALIFGVAAHVACFFDGTNATITINGVAKTKVLSPIAAGASTITLYRGASTGYFNGQITEPIYRAGPPPSASERATIMGYQKQKAGL